MTPPSAEAIAASQVCYRHCYSSFPFWGATKSGTFTDAGQSSMRDLGRHRVGRPSSNRLPTMLVAQTDPSARGCPLKPIFMPCGAPKAHDVFHEKADPCQEFSCSVHDFCNRTARNTVQPQARTRANKPSLRRQSWRKVVFASHDVSRDLFFPLKSLKRPCAEVYPMMEQVVIPVRSAGRVTSVGLS